MERNDNPLLGLVQVNLAHNVVDHGPLKLEIRVLGDSNRREILWMDGHPQRLHTRLGSHPFGNGLNRFLRVALFLGARVDRKSDSRSSSFVGRTANTN